jgi:TRAP-type uncharacterized transport system fused permease subunit
VAVGVVATYVFHFVLFGVLATRIGLGQLFLDVASSIAGRYAGGPAKVSVFGSAMFGMLSGSSVANAVTVGSLTIPAMIRVGYKREFAGAVEAASSTGGQITPPVLGAAAFLMIEFLSVPYQTIIVAAAVPAFMHFFGVFMQVHFEAKRYGLRGLTEDEMPKLRESFAERWPTLIPLVLLIGILVSGRTPYLAAFTGISSAPSSACAPACAATRRHWALLAVLHGVLLVLVFGGIESEAVKLGIFAAALVARPGMARASRSRAASACRRWWRPSAPAPSTRWRWARRRPRWASSSASSRSPAWASSSAPSSPAPRRRWPAAWAAGCRRRSSPAVADAAGGPGDDGPGVHPAGLRHPHHGQLHHHGHGGRAHAGGLGVEPLVAHFFVFYYGVLADITPPVALAAYAAAGMAGSDPFKTGNMAFRLGLAKALVPFVFVFSPSLLIVAKGFTPTTSPSPSSAACWASPCWRRRCRASSWWR